MPQPPIPVVAACDVVAASMSPLVRAAGSTVTTPRAVSPRVCNAEDRSAAATPRAATRCVSTGTPGPWIEDSSSVVWSEVNSLRSSVGELTDCVEDLQSNMATVLSMMAAMLTRREDDDEVKLQRARLAEMIGLLKPRTTSTEVVEVAKEAHTMPVNSLAITAGSCGGIGPGSTPSKEASGELRSPRMQRSPTEKPYVPISNVTPLKAFGRSNYASNAKAETIVSIDTPQGRQTCPTKSPYKPGRVPQPGPSRCPSSPPKFHRMPPAIGDKVEPMNRILPPPRETPKKDGGQQLLHAQSPSKEDLIQPRQLGASPCKESSDKAHQSVCNLSPGRRRTDVHSTSMATLQAVWSRTPPVAVCVEVLKSTPRGGSLVEWMQSAHPLHARAGSQPALETDEAKMSL